MNSDRPVITHPYFIELHRTHRRQPFSARVPLDRLTAQDQEILRKYGAWLLALAEGHLRPYTKGQERFLQVSNGELPPQSIYEIAWRNYQQLLYERDEKKREEDRNAFLVRAAERKEKDDYLAARKEHYESLGGEQLSAAWEARSQLEPEEAEVLRQVLREKLNIGPAYGHGAQVCRQCGQVGSNCTCGRTWF